MVCAVRRVMVSLLQAGGTEEKFLGYVRRISGGNRVYLMILRLLEDLMHIQLIPANRLES